MSSIPYMHLQLYQLQHRRLCTGISALHTLILWVIRRISVTFMKIYSVSLQITSSGRKSEIVEQFCQNHPPLQIVFLVHSLNRSSTISSWLGKLWSLFKVSFILTNTPVTIVAIKSHIHSTFYPILHSTFYPIVKSVQAIFHLNEHPCHHSGHKITHLFYLTFEVRERQSYWFLIHHPLFCVQPCIAKSEWRLYKRLPFTSRHGFFFY